jgi:rubredoxin
MRNCRYVYHHEGAPENEQTPVSADYEKSPEEYYRTKYCYYRFHKRYCRYIYHYEETAENEQKAAPQN